MKTNTGVHVKIPAIQREQGEMSDTSGQKDYSLCTTLFCLMNLAPIVVFLQINTVLVVARTSVVLSLCPTHKQKNCF